ncbi:MAG: thioredoxin [Microbacterium sp.]|nr:MAG: thioredoxin [Microbacterium sp.]PZU38598.1 MAG: thioredoxin [Microbacterium sp.]
MTLIDAILVLAALLAVTVGVGVCTRWQQNRPRHLDPSEIVEAERLGAEALGDRATLLQFSTEMCSRCPGVHRTLGAIAEEREGVLHLDVDLTHRPDIAKHFHVLQTPTTLILDRDGVIQTRFGGTPSRSAVELELDRVSGRDVHV